MAKTRRNSRKKPWYKTFLDRLEQVPNVRAACQAAGIDRSTAYRARQQDETFALAWADAVEAGLDAMEQIIHARGTTGQPMTKTTRRFDSEGKLVEETIVEERHISDSLAMFFLKRYRPEFRESFRVEQTGAGGGPVKHEVTVVEDTVEEFYAELDRLAAAAANGDGTD